MRGFILAAVLLARTAGAATFLFEIQTVPSVPGIGHVVTPDGRFMYSSDFVFTRDLGSGMITATAGFDPGVVSADAIALGSADAAFLYVSGLGGTSVLARDASLGGLTPVEVEPRPPGATNPRSLAVSRDGTNLYGTGLSSIQSYVRDPSTGELTFLEEIDDGTDPGEIDGLGGSSDVIISPDDQHVYVAGPTDNAVVAFARSAPDGALVHIATYESDLIHPRPEVMAFSPDGLDLYVANSGIGMLRYARNPLDGTLAFVSIEPGFVKPGLERFAGDNERLVMSADGTRLVGQVQAYVVVYDRNVGTGALTMLTLERASGRRDMTISPDGANVYAGTKPLSVFAFDSISCTPAPAAGCQAPAAGTRSALSIRDTIPSRDKITWRTTPAGVTSIADFGDPVGGSDHVAFCVYDASANPQPVAETVAPARGTCNFDPCWERSSATTLKYNDPIGVPTGLQKITVKQRVADHGAIRLKARGGSLTVPGLPLTPPVRVQLQSRTGACWEATYTTPRRNETTGFVAKSD